MRDNRDGEKSNLKMDEKRKKETRDNLDGSEKELLRKYEKGV